MQHDWTESTYGHGETMCRRCGITNREAAVLGLLNECEAKSSLEDRLSVPIQPHLHDALAKQ